MFNNSNQCISCSDLNQDTNNESNITIYYKFITLITLYVCWALI